MLYFQVVPSNTLTININDNKMIHGYTILFLYEIMLPYMYYTYDSNSYQTIEKPLSSGLRFLLKTSLNRVTIKVLIGYRIFLKLLDCCEFGWLRICDGPETFKCIQVKSTDPPNYQFDYFAILIEIYWESYYIPAIRFHYETLTIANTNVKVSSGGSFPVQSKNDGIMHKAFTFRVNVPMKIVFDVRKFLGMTGNNCIYGGKY